MSEKVRKELIRLRDDAVNAAAPFHKRMAEDYRIYRNDNSYKDSTHVGKIVSWADEQLYPKIAEVINKVHPRLDEGSPRAYFIPDRSSEDVDIKETVQVLQDWHDMYEEADDEGNKQSVAAGHVLTGGMAIRKVRWDVNFDRLNCPVISPLTFAPDPRCCEISLSDADYVVQTQKEGVNYLKRHYNFRKRNADDKSYRLDEIWLRKAQAQDIGMDADGMVRAVLVDDKLVHQGPSPWIYPDFPYACWRNFMILDDSGKPNQFWGFGFSRFLWTQQKVLDELLANLLLIVRNQAVGRFLSKEGALDTEQVLPIHGLNIELNEGFNLNDVLHLPPDQIPPVLHQIIQFIVQIMESLSGVTAVFSGEAPFSGMSGRAVAALQTAAFTHISNMIRGLIAYRIRLARMKAVLIQQVAQKPVDRNLWRGGIDIKDEFPSVARHIGFTVEISDTSQLPVTPAGRLQLADHLLERGIITKEKYIEITGIDKAYGIRSEDVMMPPMGGLGLGSTLSEDILSGREAITNA